MKLHSNRKQNKRLNKRSIRDIICGNLPKKDVPKGPEYNLIKYTKKYKKINKKDKSKVLVIDSMEKIGKNEYKYVLKWVDKVLYHDK